MPNNADVCIVNSNPITGSVCETCKHLVKRVIIPFDDEEFGINREELEIPEDEEIFYEHFFCKEMFMDIDHVVVSCNKYEKENTNCLLFNKKLL